MKTARPIFFFLIFLSWSTITRGQIVINEVSSFNDSGNGLIDEDGDAEDWIELYNAGATSVDLSNYKLIDGSSDTFTLPSVVIPSGDYLLIFASGKNRTVVVNHWETAINDTAIWRYEVPSAEPPSNWNDLSFDDSGIAQAIGGFGYGDGDDNTILSNPISSVYIRKEFVIPDINDISSAILDIDIDDGFVAYLNGVEIARSNNITGQPPTYDTYTTIDHEAQMYSGGDPSRYLIHDSIIENTLVTGTNVLAIQAHNANAFSSDMTVRPFLSFGISSGSSYFYNTPSWFSGATSILHTNFKLDKDGEQLSLLDESNTIIDQVNTGAMQLDHSAGRQPDGNTNWVIFDVSTPGATNNASTGYFGYCPDVLTFDLPAGFYNSSQTVSITGSSEIRYTIDGSLPTSSSTLYTGPIAIDTTTPVRAACFSSGFLPGEVVTNTYFINQDKDLPVISLTTNPENFWDYNEGIYVDGPGWTAPMPHTGANYWMDWEKPVHIEFFDNTGTEQFEQDAGTQIFGGWSRTQDQKSLRIKAKSMYGKNRIDYKFFEDKKNSSFKQIVLRNSGNDFLNSNLRDGTNQSNIVGATDFEYQSFQPAILFINGQYWGIQNIREKINDHFIEDNSGFPSDEIDLIDTWGQTIAGDASDFWILHWGVTNSDLSDQSNYDNYSQYFDMESMADYFACNLFLSNWDWPQNNLKLWRHRTGEYKLRYIMYDTDITHGVWGLLPMDSNMISRLMDGSTDPHSQMMTSFLANPDYRNYFINRSADLMNTIYLPTYFNNTLDQVKNEMDNELPIHYARWGGNMFTHDYYIQELRDYINQRPALHRDHIEERFSLNKQVDITLEVNPPGAGYIKINTIYPESLPWTGVYFDGVPVTITAVANPGYSFDRWEAPLISGSDPNKSITLNVDQDATFTAFFTGSSVPLELTINEINYNSSIIFDTDDWLELYNYGSVDLDISGWSISDSRDYNSYVMPEGTVIASGEYLVVCNDTTKFKQVNPTVSNYIGNLGFSFSNAGELIELYDAKGDLVEQLLFDDEAPWDVLADGQGYTLEKITPSDDGSLSTSWEARCVKGSPGSMNGLDCIVSLEEEQPHNNDIYVFPNPTQGMINILINSEGYESSLLEILDARGVPVVRKRLQGIEAGYLEQVSLFSLPKGIYSVSLKGEGKMSVQKIVVL